MRTNLATIASSLVAQLPRYRFSNLDRPFSIIQYEISVTTLALNSLLIASKWLVLALFFEGPESSETTSRLPRPRSAPTEGSLATKEFDADGTTPCELGLT